MMKYNKYILSMSFGNLHGGVGGVDKYVITQQKNANENNIGYLYLFYVKKIIKNKMIGFRFGLILDGKYLGIYTANQIIKFLKVNKINIEVVYINHLLFAKLNEIDKILSFVNKKIYLILHDYYSCCSNYFLAKNYTYCNANNLGDNPCLDCPKYEESLDKESKIWTMLNKYKENLYFFSVSNCTKNIFLKFHTDIDSNRVIVVPNQNIIIEKDDSKVLKNSKLKIAFLGNSNLYKGWDEFKTLVNKFKCNYDFYLFNSYGKIIDGAKTINAKYDSKHINGMVDFIKEENIDVVVLWAKWPETFSYVACEALASKCYMIAYKYSGNIVDIIKNYKSGIIYDSFEDLLNDMLNQEQFEKVVNEYRSSLNNISIKNVDNANLINGLNDQTTNTLEHKFKMPSNLIHPINCIFNIILKKKYNMEDI